MPVVLSLRGDKPQNRLLSNFNTGGCPTGNDIEQCIVSPFWVSHFLSGIQLTVAWACLMYVNNARRDVYVLMLYRIVLHGALCWFWSTVLER